VTKEIAVVNQRFESRLFEFREEIKKQSCGDAQVPKLSNTALPSVVISSRRTTETSREATPLTSSTVSSKGNLYRSDTDSTRCASGSQLASAHGADEDGDAPSSRISISGFLGEIFGQSK